MKELVDRYRPVRQRTVRSETTKDKGGALPREGIEQNTCMPPSADHDDGVTGITFVDDSVVAVAD